VCVCACVYRVCVQGVCACVRVQGVCVYRGVCACVQGVCVQGVSGGIVNILGGGSMDCSE
jgi:hypothetical protein